MDSYSRQVVLNLARYAFRLNIAATERHVPAVRAYRLSMINAGWIADVRRVSQVARDEIIGTYYLPGFSSLAVGAPRLSRDRMRHRARLPDRHGHFSRMIAYCTIPDVREVLKDRPA